MGRLRRANTEDADTIVNENSSGTLTFLFTDVEGSTQYWDLRPVEMKAALAQHDEIVSRQVVAHRGRIIKPGRGGDSFLAVFDRAIDAVQAILAVQTELREAIWPPGVPLRVRAALHSGEAESRDDDYFGATVVRCARLMAIAHGGQSLISRVTQELVRDALPADVSLRHLGQHRLKDLQRPEDVFELSFTGRSERFPPLRSLSTVSNNLPIRLTSFIGRDRDTERVAYFLSEHRLVTITGMGGIGKTRLALHVAAEKIGDFEDGVWWIDLASLTDSQQVQRAVASVLGVREIPERPLILDLADAVGRRSMLLLMDNAEHLRSATAETIAHMLERCQNLHALVTSRVPLGVGGELTWDLAGLSVAAPGAVGDLLSAEPSDAVRLFVDRARLVHPEITLTPQVAADVADLCLHLDGLPLAVELAAARTRSLPPREILVHLDQRFELLTAVGAVESIRHQSLHSAIQWSIDLLSRAEQVLFDRLSVFADGFDLAAVEAVAAGGVIRRCDILSVLSVLVASSLVEVTVDSEGHARYQMLETLREFARRRFARTRERRSVLRRFASYYFALVLDLEPQLKDKREGAAFRHLEREHNNLRAVFRQALQGADARMALEMCGALGEFWHVRGYFSEGREWAAAALALSPGKSSLSARSKALRVASKLAFAQGDVDEAQRGYEELLQFGVATGDRADQAMCLNNLAVLQHHRADYPEARVLYERSLMIKRELGDRQAISKTLYNLGLLAHWEGDLRAAASFIEESLQMAREVGDTVGEAQALVDLGVVWQARGDITRAMACLDQGLALCRMLDDRKSTAWTLDALAHLYRQLDQADTSRVLLHECLAIAESLGDRGCIAAAVESMAKLDLEAGEIDRAQDGCQRSLSIRQTIGDRQRSADSLATLGQIALMCGDCQTSAAYFRDSLLIRRETGQSIRSCVSVEDVACLLACQGHAETALHLAGAAAAQRERLGAPIGVTAGRRLARGIASAQAALGKGSAEKALAQGRTMTIDAAMSLALDRLPPAEIVLNVA